MRDQVPNGVSRDGDISCTLPFIGNEDVDGTGSKSEVGSQLGLVEKTKRERRSSNSRIQPE